MEKHQCCDDIVFEILTWLPAKSLMRFNSVSKAWNTLIRHNLNFAKSHMARSQARPTASRLLFELDVVPDEEEYPATKEKNRRLEEFPLQQVAPHHCFYRKEMQICSNHCNGLVCLYSVKDTQVYLFNVTTGELKALPFSMNEHPFYLGFDLVTEKYKLLHVFEENNDDNRITKMRILTLGTKYSSWRILSMPSIISSSRCIYLKGVLYWPHFSRSYIFYFDLKEEEFGVVSLPQEYSYFALLNDMQTAVRGKLVMNCYNWKFEDTDWIYDEVKRTFTKLKNSANREEEMFAFLESEKIDKSEKAQVLVTTPSVMNIVPAHLVFPHRFLLAHLTGFVDNIIPLSFLV